MSNLGILEDSGLERGLAARSDETFRRPCLRRVPPGRPADAGAARWPSHQFATVPDRAAARQMAAQVRALVDQAGQTAKPLNLDTVAKLGRFRLIETDLRVDHGGYRGLLQAVLGGFRICVDARPRGCTGTTAQETLRRRARFVIAHEIGHSFFFDRRRPRPERLLPIGSVREEDFCNEFASALLVPPEVVETATATPSVVVSIAKEWDVSLEVAARAIADWHPRRPFIALGYWRRSPAELEIQWAGGGNVASPRETAARLLGRRAKPGRNRSSIVFLPTRRQAVALAFTTA
jgi:hypothetical protein